MTPAQVEAALDRLKPSQMRAVLFCFWVWDADAFEKAVKAAKK